jgi:hypothetical protein
MSKFNSVKRAAKPVDQSTDAATAAFIAGAIERVEGVPVPAKRLTGARARARVLFSIDPAVDAMIVQISQRPVDFRSNKSAVVEAAVRAFNALPVDQQIALLRDV